MRRAKVALKGGKLIASKISPEEKQRIIRETQANVMKGQDTLKFAKDVEDGKIDINQLLAEEEDAGNSGSNARLAIALNKKQEQALFGKIDKKTGKLEVDPETGKPIKEGIIQKIEEKHNLVSGDLIKVIAEIKNQSDLTRQEQADEIKQVLKDLGVKQEETRNLLGILELSTQASASGNTKGTLLKDLYKKNRNVRNALDNKEIMDMMLNNKEIKPMTPKIYQLLAEFQDAIDPADEVAIFGDPAVVYDPANPNSNRYYKFKELYRPSILPLKQAVSDAKRRKQQKVQEIESRKRVLPKEKQTDADKKKAELEKKQLEKEKRLQTKKAKEELTAKELQKLKAEKDKEENEKKKFVATAEDVKDDIENLTEFLAYFNNQEFTKQLKYYASEFSQEKKREKKTTDKAEGADAAKKAQTALDEASKFVKDEFAKFVNESSADKALMNWVMSSELEVVDALDSKGNDKLELSWLGPDGTTPHTGSHADFYKLIDKTIKDLKSGKLKRAYDTKIFDAKIKNFDDDYAKAEQDLKDFEADPNNDPNLVDMTQEEKDYNIALKSLSQDILTDPEIAKLLAEENNIQNDIGKAEMDVNSKLNDPVGLGLPRKRKGKNSKLDGLSAKDIVKGVLNVIKQKQKDKRRNNGKTAPWHNFQKRNSKGQFGGEIMTDPTEIRTKILNVATTGNKIQAQRMLEACKDTFSKSQYDEIYRKIFAPPVGLTKTQIDDMLN